MAVLKVATVGSVVTAHPPGFIPTTVSQGSDFVFIEGQPVALLGSVCVDHACPSPPLPPHTPVVAAGSPTVLINGISIARESDPTQCGSLLAPVTHVYSV
jgi:uncharacterized Zn-binding protein involved in type VI secretion